MVLYVANVVLDLPEEFLFCAAVDTVFFVVDIVDCLLCVFGIVAVGFVFSVVNNDSKSFGWASRLLCPFNEVVVFSKKNTRAKSGSSSEVSAFNVETDAVTLLSLLLCLDFL